MEGNDKVKTIYFYKNNEAISNNERDSLMAKNIIEIWDQKSTLVLLSGNLHNIQEPRNGSIKAALQFLEMTKGSFKILSLTHSFKKGQLITGTLGEKSNSEFTNFEFTASPRMQDQ